MERSSLFEYTAEMYAKREGFTCTLKSQKSRKRYIVSITDNEIKKPLDLILSVDAFMNAAEYINVDNVYIGGWEDSGKYFLDLSVDFDRLDEAITAAKIFKQRAIWDSVQETSISVE